jgi:hypothetical protein
MAQKKSTVSTKRPPPPVKKGKSQPVKNADSKRGNGTFSTNPQDQSSSQGSIKSLSGSEKPKSKTLAVTGLYPGGNVENEIKLRHINEITPEACVNLLGNLRGKAVPRCRRQVFASTEVAENTIRSLTYNRVLVMGQVEKCKICGLIHIKELR